MVRRDWAAAALAVAALAPLSRGQELAPIRLALDPQPPSVYALPDPAAEDQGANTGGLNLNIRINYLTDYMYRGVDRSAFIGDVTGSGSSDRASFQFDGRLTFDLGKAPHPFIGVFANVLDNDPVSNFQEVRPVFGAEWAIRPFVLAAGHNLYQFPDRGALNTGEVWGRITLDDAVVLRREQPLLSPYIYGAYDYDEYRGWYLEAGVSHDWVIENSGITLTFLANTAYVIGQAHFAGPEGKDTGFHHYELGVIARYSLNLLLNIPQRYGRWSFNGYLMYTDGLDGDLRSDTKLWGGAGIELSY